MEILRSIRALKEVVPRYAVDVILNSLCSGTFPVRIGMLQICHAGEMVSIYNHYLFLFTNTFMSSDPPLLYLFFSLLVSLTWILIVKEMICCTNAKYSCVFFEDLFGPLKAKQWILFGS